MVVDSIPNLHKYVKKTNKNTYEVAGNNLQLAFRDNSILVRVGGGEADVFFSVFLLLTFY